jgi:hypothetical protein
MQQSVTSFEWEDEILATSNAEVASTIQTGQKLCICPILSDVNSYSSLQIFPTSGTDSTAEAGSVPRRHDAAQRCVEGKIKMLPVKSSARMS